MRCRLGRTVGASHFHVCGAAQRPFLHRTSRHSLEISLHGFNQLLSSTGALKAADRIDDVEPDMILDHVGHQAAQGAARSDDEVEYIGATSVLLDRSLNRLDLATYAPHAVKELLFFAFGVRHNG
jgi:hypothetical protein